MTNKNHQHGGGSGAVVSDCFQSVRRSRLGVILGWGGVQKFPDEFISSKVSPLQKAGD